MEEVRFMSVPSPMRVRRLHVVETDGKRAGWDPQPWAMVTTIRQHRWQDDDEDEDGLKDEMLQIQFVDLFGNRFGPIEYFEGSVAIGDDDKGSLHMFQLQYQGPDGWTDVFNADETLKFITA